MYVIMDICMYVFNMYLYMYLPIYPICLLRITYMYTGCMKISWIFYDMYLRIPKKEEA